MPIVPAPKNPIQGFVNLSELWSAFYRSGFIAALVAAVVLLLQYIQVHALDIFNPYLALFIPWLVGFLIDLLNRLNQGDPPPPAGV